MFFLAAGPWTPAMVGKMTCLFVCLYQAFNLSSLLLINGIVGPLSKKRPYEWVTGVTTTIRSIRDKHSFFGGHGSSTAPCSLAPWMGDTSC